MFVKLGEIVKISSGLIVSRERTSSSNRRIYNVLNYRGIDGEGNIILSALDRIDLNNKIDEKFITKENDVIMKMTYPFKALLIKKQEENLLITSNFCKIICLNKILPEYLVACLNSDKISKKLKVESKNQTINQISIKDLAGIEIELYDIEKQKKIAITYMNYLKRIQLTRMILEKEQKIIKNIYK